MDSAERRLIDLYDLLSQYQRSKDPDLFNSIHSVRNEITEILNSRSGGNDNINFNIDANCPPEPCPPGPPGPIGPEGPPGPPGIGTTGPQGPAGICSCTCNSILVSSDYTATCDNYYIGVNSENPVTISLPANCIDCCEIIVKAEMGPPLGNRKVTVTTTDGSYIDGADKYIMEVPYQSVNLFCRGGDWHII
tara:strand:+ start:154 stop:729 length:576 start_codon:yes stop_codon:yes gene_type:complete